MVCTPEVSYHTPHLRYCTTDGPTIHGWHIPSIDGDPIHSTFHHCHHHYYYQVPRYQHLTVVKDISLYLIINIIIIQKVSNIMIG